MDASGARRPDTESLNQGCKNQGCKICFMSMAALLSGEVRFWVVPRLLQCAFPVLGPSYSLSLQVYNKIPPLGPNAYAWDRLWLVGSLGQFRKEWDVGVGFSHQRACTSRPNEAQLTPHVMLALLLEHTAVKHRKPELDHDK